MAVTLKVEGLDAAIKRMEHLAKDIRRDAQDILNAFVDEVARTAKRLAPGDEGRLRNSINPVRGTGNLEASVVATVVYAAFMEFGTRKYAAQYVATLPGDWKTYASTFQGQKGNGNFEQFLNAIMAWVKRKGIDNKAAYPIALKILRDGVQPHPFLYPAVQQHLPQLRKDFKDLLAA